MTAALSENEKINRPNVLNSQGCGPSDSFTKPAIVMPENVHRSVQLIE